MLSRGGGAIRVRWEDDGMEDDVRVDGRTSLAARGSLRHQWLVAPAPLADLFAADPSGMILRLLSENGAAMTALEVKDQLLRFGLDEKAVAAAWVATQKGFAKNNHVRTKSNSYKWVGPAAEPTDVVGAEVRAAAPAVPEVDQPRVAAAVPRTVHPDPFRPEPIRAQRVDAPTEGDRSDALKRDLEEARGDAAVARAQAEASERRAQELAVRGDRLEEAARREYARAVALRASHERQIRIDVVRALADLAAEVEELATNQTGSDVLVDRVRGLVVGQALEPIGLAGAGAEFDPTLHEAIGGDPEAGAAVSVIRPGYRWRSAGEDILMHKALVAAS